MKCKICKGALRIFQKELYDDRHGYPGKFDVFICEKCGFGQLEPQLKDSAISDLYTNYYPRNGIAVQSIKDSIEFKKGILNKICRWFSGTNNVCHYHVKPGMKVLDIGCGSGVSLLEMKEMGVDAYGIEEDRNLKKPADELQLNLEIGNLYNSNFPDNFFDCITMSQVLEHISDPQRLLIVAAKKLKEKGIIIASFPNFSSIYRRMAGRKWIHWHVPFHLNYFNRESLKIIAKESDFEIIKYKNITPTTWSILQIENIIFKSTEGMSQRRWEGQHGKTTNRSIVSKIFLYPFLYILRFLFSVINKFFDFFYTGDGITIILKKK
jgi:2-polyprenyl-3-methyl-5-hydroxy-6-metoxy-1,4-benzoquinol methylase